MGCAAPAYQRTPEYATASSLLAEAGEREGSCLDVSLWLADRMYRAGLAAQMMPGWEGRDGHALVLWRFGRERFFLDPTRAYLCVRRTRSGVWLNFVPAYPIVN